MAEEENKMTMEEETQGASPEQAEPTEETAVEETEQMLEAADHPIESRKRRKKGIGKKLMDKAKEVALRQKRRAIILETQSCNTNAIGFYLHQGFELIGFDTCCYTNNDIGRREVRINLGYFFHREGHRR